MNNKLRKAISTLMIVGVLTTSAIPVAAATNVAGGIWDYGTQSVGFNQKRVYSNYFHNTKKHRSSVTIGTTYVNSGWKNKGVTSYASAKGSWFDATHAYYDYK